MVAHVGYSVSGLSRGRVTPCVVYTVHVETRSTSFLVEPQNQGRRFSLFGLKAGGDRFPGLGLKTDSSGLVICASKSPRWFFGLGLKIKHASVCRPRHKTDASRSSGLLHLEASRARVSQSGLKTSEGATAGAARDTIMEVASGSN
jgi:hypothetical protein